jgi:hypothetical protein
MYYCIVKQERPNLNACLGNGKQCDICTNYQSGNERPQYPVPAIPVLFDPITAFHQGKVYHGTFIEHAITGETLNWYE